MNSTGGRPVDWSNQANWTPQGAQQAAQATAQYWQNSNNWGAPAGTPNQPSTGQPVPGPVDWANPTNWTPQGAQQAAQTTAHYWQNPPCGGASAVLQGQARQ